MDLLDLQLKITNTIDEKLGDLDHLYREDDLMDISRKIQKFSDRTEKRYEYANWENYQTENTKYLWIRVINYSNGNAKLLIENQDNLDLEEVLRIIETSKYTSEVY